MPLPDREPMQTAFTQTPAPRMTAMEAAVSGTAAPGTAAPQLANPQMTAPDYSAEIGTDLAAFLARCELLAGPTTSPFHSAAWLRAWYEVFAPGTSSGSGLEPLFVTVRHRADSREQRDALLLPLVSRRQAGLRVVKFADQGVVDYNAPVVARDWHGGHAPERAAPALWAAVRQALRGYDLFQVHKLLPRLLDEAGNMPNPLALALTGRPCQMFGNQFAVRGDWQAWRNSLDRHTRKEIERSWRVFQRSDTARFERVTDVQEALVLFETLERQQSARLAERTPNYAGDTPRFKAFYRKALAAGVEGGSVVLTVLRDGEHVVSALFGLANGERYIGLRQSINAADTWRPCSPGRLLDEQTARHMHEQGLLYFDFGIGDYFHKQALKMQMIPLLDVCQALSWRGLPLALAWELRQRLQSLAWLVSLKRRLWPRRV